MKQAVILSALFLSASVLAQSQQATAPKRLQVDGQVMYAKRIKAVSPKYPSEAKRRHIEGVVKLVVVIGTDGTIQGMRTLSGDPILVEAASKAVKKWRYRPTTVNGEPEEMETEIDVNFTLSN